MPGGMGFAISNADLFKTKLRPVSIADDGKKPMQAVEPMAQNEATALVSKARDGIDVSIDYFLKFMLYVHLQTH